MFKFGKVILTTFQVKILKMKQSSFGYCERGGGRCAVRVGARCLILSHVARVKKPTAMRESHANQIQMPRAHSSGAEPPLTRSLPNNWTAAAAASAACECLLA